MKPMRRSPSPFVTAVIRRGPSSRSVAIAASVLALVGAGSACGARSQLRDTPGADVVNSGGANVGGAGGAGSAGTVGSDVGGSGGSSCNGVPCDDPPPPTCLSSTTVTSFNPTGKCSGGECVYSKKDAACPAICSGGACLPEPSSIHLTVGSQHSCVTAVTGGIKCWGHNDGGQLGDGSAKETGVPIAVAGLSSGMLALAASGDTCAVTVAGALLCWGHNESGQLGDGSTQGHLTPTTVSGLGSGARAVAAGGLHTCAVTSAGAVLCWGEASSGQLGNGTTNDSFVPVAVKGLSSGATAVAVGFGHSCAIAAGGALRCWGLNKYGELGNGTATEVPVKAPVDVKGLSSGVTAVASSSLTTCAIVDGGGVKCWGHNLDGEVGDGTTQDSSIPVDVKGLSAGVTAIGVGTSHSCAVTKEGGVKCWGNNSFGQIGDNSTTVRHEPVDVVGLSSGVVAVALGFDHTCAVLTTGAVKCWGGNFYSQLGDGTTTQSLVPIDVKGL
jgi:alpha-tubulin suppressor-like RCC1 family protein